MITRLWKSKSIRYSFALAAMTVVGFCFVLLYNGIFPFGDLSVLRIDLNIQYADFISWFVNSSLSEKIYSFSKGLGGPTTGLVAYYCLSPFNLLLCAFSPANIEVGVFLITLLKFVFLGQSAYWYLNKHFKDSAINIFCALIYALYPYFIRYYFNIIWADCFALLPLLIYAAENLIEGKKAWPFIVLYTFSLLSNYYIAFMSSVFVLIYFFYYSFCVLKIDIRKTLSNIFKMAYSVLISVMFASPVLIPALLQLRNGKLTGEDGGFARTASMFNPEAFGFELWDGALFVDGFPVFTACVCTTFLLTAFCMSAKFRKAENFVLFAIWLFLCYSAYNPVLYYVWHGFAWPEGFTPRFTFLYAFVLAVICRRAFAFLDGKAAIGAVAVGLLVYAYAIYFIRTYDYFPWRKSTVLLTLVSVAVCIGVMLLAIRHTGKAKMLLCMYMAVNVICCSALQLKSETALATLGLPDYGDYKEEYTAVAQVLEKTNDDGFYRVEDLNARPFNQPMGLQYNGINHFSSTFDMSQKELLVHLGYADTFYSTVYGHSDVLSDSVLGLKYLIANEGTAVPESYERIYSGEKNLYYNPFYLPILYTGSTNAIVYNEDWRLHVNNMAIALTGYDLLDASQNVLWDNAEAFANELRKTEADIIRQNGGYISATAEGEYLLTSIIYDENWQIKVNGNAVAPEKYMEHFLSVPLAEGENHIVMYYVPDGLACGLLLMFAGAVVTLSVFIAEKHKKRQRCRLSGNKKCNEEAALFR